MPTDVIMPALGVAQEKGTLIRWLKAEGEAVAKGEPLMEIETDKATVEIEAPAAGILAGVSAFPGDEVPVGNRIAVILAPGEAGPAASVPNLDTRLEGEAKSVRHPAGKREREAEGGATAQSPQSGKRILASPAARRIAREKGIDLATVAGSGPARAVLAQDVMRFAGEGALAPTVPLTPMRRMIAERMTRSKQTAPHFYVSIDVDMSAIGEARTARAKNASRPVPSINDFILIATARVLRAFPPLNASFTDRGLTLHSEINLGMAVALEDGLVVPVIRRADELTLEEIARRSRELADKAQTRKLLPSDYQSGTFTVSNLGMFGVDHFVAIINPPEVGILAAGQVRPRVVVHEGGFAARPIMTLTLSADHRAVDGAIAARFLGRLKETLENGPW